MALADRVSSRSVCGLPALRFESGLWQLEVACKPFAVYLPKLGHARAVKVALNDGTKLCRAISLNRVTSRRSHEITP